MIGWSKRQCGSIRPHKQAESSAERRREIQITVSLILVTIIVRENVKRSNFRLLGKTAVCLSGPIWTRRRFRLNRCVERFDQNKFSSRNFSTQEFLYLAQKMFSGNLVWLLNHKWFFWSKHFQYFIYTFFPFVTKHDLPNPISNPDLKKILLSKWLKKLYLKSWLEQ